VLRTPVRASRANAYWGQSETSSARPSRLRRALALASGATTMRSTCPGSVTGPQDAVRRCGISLETVRSATSIPSFRVRRGFWGRPTRIRLSHTPDKSPDLGADGRAATSRLAGALGPVLAGAAPPPTQDGIGRHDHEGRSPPRPHPGQADPEEPLAAVQFRPAHRPLVHGELLAEGEVLESELPVAAVEEWAESKQVEQRADRGGDCLRIRAERSTAYPREGLRRRTATGRPAGYRWAPRPCWSVRSGASGSRCGPRP
jgi:hypothetical protein